MSGGIDLSRSDFRISQSRPLLIFKERIEVKFTIKKSETTLGRT
jgi:hypothetical protein